MPRKKIVPLHPFHGEAGYLFGQRDALGDRYRQEIERHHLSLQRERERATRKILNPGFALETTDWQADAACKNADPNYFFPMEDEEVKKTSPWVPYCISCPVRQACGEFADRNGLVGVWGGMYRTGTFFKAGLRGRPRKKGRPLASPAATVAVETS